MGLKHQARPGTTIEANGVVVTVLRGRPHLEVSAPHEVVITIDRKRLLTASVGASNNARRSKRSRADRRPSRLAGAGRTRSSRCGCARLLFPFGPCVPWQLTRNILQQESHRGLPRSTAPAVVLRLHLRPGHDRRAGALRPRRARDLRPSVRAERCRCRIALRTPFSGCCF